MSKKSHDHRVQPEFFFVFEANGGSRHVQVTVPPTEECGGAPRESLASDVAKEHRDKLLAELHRFGC